MEPDANPPPLNDFFVSYASEDLAFAQWIARTLEDARYKIIIQAWDFRPGQNFIARMHQALRDSRRTIAVLSANYLASLFTEAEWTAAFAEGRLLPVRVAACTLPGLFRTMIYCDLVGLSKEEAGTALLEALPARNAPASVPFPGSPGQAVPAREALVEPYPNRLAAARDLLSVLETSRTTFRAQVLLRNQLVAQMTLRQGIKQVYQYEEFFDRFYPEMDERERRKHAIIRSYTKDVLREYNERALALVERFPELERDVHGVGPLQRHLVMWLAKYRAVFEQTESMCLVYVGVEENVPFPHGLEEVLRRYVEGLAP